MKASILWELDLDFCLACRDLHRKRSRPGKPDLPLCEKTRAKGKPPECEFVREWEDSKGITRTDPLILLPSNYRVLELYERIARFGVLQTYKYKRGEDIYTTYFPDLSMMEFVLKNFLPEGTTLDEYHKLVDQIGTIHNLKLNNILAG